MTPPASRPTISGEPQPQLLPSIRARTIAVSAAVSSDDAGVVDVAADAVVARLADREEVAATAPTATGRLMKKIARQLTYSVRTPPTTGPIASASAETPAQVPIALPRSCGREGVGDDRERRRHHQRGADALDRAAEPISIVGSWAKPGGRRGERRR